tara:strand:+ start:58 stop:279 length:222 start_codon:yes stop_codon:yes gene_type:complete
MVKIEKNLLKIILDKHNISLNRFAVVYKVDIETVRKINEGKLVREKSMQKVLEATKNIKTTNYTNLFKEVLDD